MQERSYGAIFDMDGVLVDSTEAHYEAWHRLGEEVGVPFERALFDETFGMTNYQIIPMWLGALLAIAGLGYLVDSIGILLFPQYNLSLGEYTFFGELILIFWLLWRGIKGFPQRLQAALLL